MKYLTHIILTSKKPKEKDEAMVLKKQIENFDFVYIQVGQCKIFQIVNIPSKAMQCKTIDLISAHKLLQTVMKTLLKSGGVLTQYYTKLPLLLLLYMGFAETVF